MSTDLTESRGVTNPLVLIESAIERGIPVDQLGKLMDLQERWERNRAAEEFSHAVATFQGRCNAVLKSKTATVRSKSGGSFEYKFASFDDVMREAGPILADCGLAVTFFTEPAENAMKVTCRVRKGSHFEDHPLTLPIPEAVVNDAQRYGMALSYAKRYAMCAALNIVTTADDDDGTSLLEHISPDEAKQLLALIEEKEVDLHRFLKWANAGSVLEIPKSDFAKCLDILKRKKKNGNGKPAHDPQYGPDVMEATT